MTQHQTQSDLLDQLLAEYMRQVDLGTADRDAFLSQHPAHAEELRDLLATEDTILRLAGPMLGESAADDPQAVTRRHEPDPANVSTQAHVIVSESPKVSESGTDVDTAKGGAVGPLAEISKGNVSFGNYELLEILGRGGMGVVYRARQQGLDREVAVKMILNAHLASNEDIERFYSEARAAAKIRHEHVVDIYEIGEVDGQRFFSMELVDGCDLSELLREGRLDSRRAAKMLRDVADAVHAAHELGVLHRDLKPANILLDDQDRVVVTDFGLARSLSAEDQQRLTSTGLAMGTPAYMSPEQASGKRELVGRPSDVYALGTVLFSMLTGKPPHRGKTVMDTLMAVIHHPAEHPGRLNAEADPALCRICLKCLDKDPDNRYQTAKELSQDLTRFLDGQPVLAQDLPPLQRAARWMGQVPLVAALRGRLSHHPTRAHLRVQAALILLMLAVVVAAFSYSRVLSVIRNRMPSVIAIASGQPDGVYDQFAVKLAAAIAAEHRGSVQVVETGGSGDNRDALLQGNVNLALLQESMVGSEQIVVVAPMFEELVHVIVRRDRIGSWQDLSGARIAVGSENSGMAAAARLVLRNVQCELVFEPFSHLVDDDALDAAVVTMGLGGAAIDTVVERDTFDLIALPEDVIQQVTADPTYGRGSVQLPDGTRLASVSTPAFLACRRDAPAPLVRAALQHLYPAITPHQMTREAARHWSFMPLHPVARRFFEQMTDHPSEAQEDKP